MKIFQKQFLIGSVVAGLLFLASPVFADTITVKPINLSIGIGGVRQVSDLPQYLGVIYKWFVGAAMVIAAFMITLGGFQYVASAGTPKYVGMAKSRMVNGLMGLILVIGSYVLLNSINPAFTNLRLPEIEAIKRIDLPTKFCRDYLTQETCEADVRKIAKDPAKKCRWGANSCFDPDPQTGSVGGPCPVNGECGASKFCVRSLADNQMAKDVCTDAKPGSPCNPHANPEDLTAYGCLDPANNMCDADTLRCKPKAKAQDGKACKFGTDTECQSGYCKNKVCAPSAEKPVLCNPDKTCPQLPGKKIEEQLWCCSTEDQCEKSDMGSCLEKRLVGDVCVDSGMCASAPCNLATKSCYAASGEECSNDVKCDPTFKYACTDGKCVLKP